MIKNITLTNFRSHINQTFDFESGVNVIIGPNGSGKTSILLALQTVLFGSRPVPLKYMVHTGASNAAVQINYNDLSVFRAFGDESAYNISKDGNSIVSGAKDCEAYLQKLFGNLGMLVAAPQANQLYPLDNQKVLDEFFDFTAYQEAFKYLLLPLREIEKDLEALIREKVVLDLKQEELQRKEQFMLNLRCKITELETNVPDKPKDELFLEISELSSRINQNDLAFRNLSKYIVELEKDKAEYWCLQNLQADYENQLATYHASLAGDGDLVYIRFAEIIRNSSYCPVCGSYIKDAGDLADDLITDHRQPEMAPYPTDNSAKIEMLQEKIARLPEIMEERNKLDKLILNDGRKLVEMEASAQAVRDQAKVYRDWELGLATTRVQLESTELEVLTLYKELERLPILVKEHEELERKLEVLKDIREVVRNIPDKLRDGVSEYLQKGLKAHLQTAPCLKLDKLEVNGFMPIVNGLSLNLLSGAQQATVAVIMRVLLCQLIGSPLFIMDEPTNNMDKDTRQWLVEFINRLDFEQIIVVTHDDLIDGDNIIRLGE